jgi:hypothetical protein
MSFPARYPSYSAACCGEPIYEGDMITYDGDEIVHEECADDHRPPPSGGVPAFGPRRN